MTTQATPQIDEAELRATVQARIREAMARAGIEGPSELARTLGCDTRTAQRYLGVGPAEAHRLPTTTMLAALAHALDVTTDYLLGREDPS